MRIIPFFIFLCIIQTSSIVVAIDFYQDGSISDVKELKVYSQEGELIADLEPFHRNLKTQIEQAHEQFENEGINTIVASFIVFYGNQLRPQILICPLTKLGKMEVFDSGIKMTKAIDQTDNHLHLGINPPRFDEALNFSQKYSSPQFSQHSFIENAKREVERFNDRREVFLEETGDIFTTKDSNRDPIDYEFSELDEETITIQDTNKKML